MDVIIDLAQHFPQRGGITHSHVISVMCLPECLPDEASPLDLEIDRVERIDSTRLKIDRLDRSTRLASHCLQAYSFFAAQLQLSSVFFIVMSVCQSQPCTVLMVTRQLADMPTREIT